MFERSIIHLILHFFVPAIIARVFYRTKWLYAYTVLMSTMLIDLDHLLASPVYDANRCSIGFHPLHSEIAITVYIIALVSPRLRLLAIGLLTHILLDASDCVWMLLT